MTTKKTSVAKKTDEPTTFVGWLSQQSQQERLATLLRGGLLTPQEFVERIVIAFSSDPKIDACTDRSKFEVTLELAALGLTPDWDHVALIPRNQRSGGPRLTYMLQYQGVKALIDRSELIKDTSVVLIHKNDAGMYDFDPALRQVVWHKDFDPFDEDREFNTIDDVRGGYLIVKYTDGRPDKHVLVPRKAFLKARECAETKNIWDRFLEPQCHKTVYHYAYARREVSVDSKVAGLMTRAIDNEYEVTGADPMRAKAQPPKRVAQSMATFDEEPVIEAQYIEAKPEPEPEPEPVKKKAVRKKAVKKQAPPVSDPEPTEDELLAAVNNSDMRMLTDANFSMFVSGIQMCRDRATLNDYVANFDPATPELDVAMTEEIENHLKELANRALEAAE